MVRAPVSGPSRAASSRGGSVAREILKKREKPYKSEYEVVMAKKRPLNTTRTVHAEPPKGYTYMPVGTPDLANRCKDLSKQRELPVNEVNAKPHNKHADDPSKLAHYSHRVGWHFNNEVIEQAMEELGYTIQNGRFVKEEDLTKRWQESRTAQILIKHGVTRRNSDWTSESHDQVRDAIKELFPSIPDDDLEGVVKHAWEDGKDRVGSARGLELHRRVQLAVIARIRHKYTDYDYLLKAGFPWAETRRQVEQPLVNKLIEWRGEDNDEDDEGLQEIVREVIVIDDEDDSEAMKNGSEADDEDSAAEQGNYSNATIEVTQHNADDTDIGGESTHEAQPTFFRRLQQAPRRLMRQANLAREKIAAAYQQRRIGVPPAPAHPTMRMVQVPDGVQAGSPMSFEKDGVVYHPLPGPIRTTQHESSRAVPPLRQQPGLWQSQQAPEPSPFLYAPYPVRSRNAPLAQDRPVASIERDCTNNSARDSYPQSPKNHHGHRRPITPDQGYSSKRRRTDQGTQHLQASPHGGHVVDLTTPDQPRRRGLPSYRGELVDLTTPEPQHQPQHPSPLREVRVAPYENGQVQQQRRNENVQDASIAHQPSPMRIEQEQQIYANPRHQAEDDSLAYDPTQPMLQLPKQVDRLSIRPDQKYQSHQIIIPAAYPLPPAHVAPQYPQHPPQPRSYYGVPYQAGSSPNGHTQPVISYPQAPVVYDQGPSRPTPQPIHGAPAPVQVLPRHLFQYGRPPTVPPPVPPTDGAPAPAQYLPR